MAVHYVVTRIDSDDTSDNVKAAVTQALKSVPRSPGVIICRTIDQERQSVRFGRAYLSCERLVEIRQRAHGDTPVDVLIDDLHCLIGTANALIYERSCLRSELDLLREILMGAAHSHAGECF